MDSEMLKLAERLDAEIKRVRKFKGSTEFTTYWEGYADACSWAAKNVRAMAQQ